MARILLTSILDEWWNTGRLRPPHPVVQGDLDPQTIMGWVSNTEKIYRKQLPEGVPTVALDVAAWALEQFFRASQLLVFRELGDEFIQLGLRDLPLVSDLHPAEPIFDSSVHYSVDLSFRFLPDLRRLVSAASGNGALLEQIDRWIDWWPLSGASSASQLATKTLGSLESDESAAKQWIRAKPVFQNSGLRTMYTERFLGSNPSKEKIDSLHEWITRLSTTVT